ncbi:MAG: glutamyl-tRNA reductase [Spirochaetota bacterium]
MRTLYIGDSRLFDHNLSLLYYQKGYRIYQGYKAYQLLLEIISGLHSRLLGETEVLFQFKETFKNSALPDVAIGGYMQKLRDQLIEDTRKIRSRYLYKLGDQSYGGIAYRYLKNKQNISLFGSGQLAEQMLPWLLKTKAKITLWGRNAKRLAELAARFPIATGGLSSYKNTGENIVIAAPHSFRPWLSSLQGDSLVLDFREDDANDRFPKNLHYVSFAEMLESLKQQELKNRTLRKKLILVAEEIVEEREYNVHHNLVYCWEELYCHI